MARSTRRRPWGSITEVQRGKKQVVRWVENTDRGRVRRSKTLYCTYREASKWLSAKQVELGEQHRSPTIGEVYDAWYLPMMQRRVESGSSAPRTLKLYTDYWNKRCRPQWGAVHVDCIKVEDVQRWLLSMPKNAAMTCLALMKKVVDEAVKYDQVEVNKFRSKYEMPTETVRKKRDRVYRLGESVEIAGRLLGLCPEPAFIISAFGGARVGESLGVKVDDVTVDEVEGRRYVLVGIHRQMPARGHEPLPDGEMKTDDSDRTIIIPWEYGYRLVEIAEQRRVEGIEWLSVNPQGLAMGTLDYRRDLDRQLGDDSTTPSKLRAAWRTYAQFEWRIDENLLELLMGHRIATTTNMHYLFPSMHDLVVEFDRCFATFRSI